MFVELESLSIFSSTVILGLSSLVMLVALFRRKENVTQKEPNVSIVTVAWNEGPRIRRCIESLLRMDYPRGRREIIVVGGGTDKTSVICKKYAKSGLIRFFEEKERSGKWFALNRGIEKARYDYIAFTDSDGMVGKDWLRNMSSYRDIDIAVSPVIVMHENGIIGKCFSMANAYLWLIAYSLNKILKTSMFSGTGAFMKKSVAKKVRFERSKVEDYRFCNRAMGMGYNVQVVLDNPVYQGHPKTFSDWKKCYMRIFYGLMSEMLFLKDRGIIILLGIGAMTMVSLISGIVTNQIVAGVYIYINVALICVSFLNLILTCNAYKSYKYLKMAPHLILFYAFVQITAVETFFRWLFRRQILWEMYNKT